MQLEQPQMRSKVSLVQVSRPSEHFIEHKWLTHVLCFTVAVCLFSRLLSLLSSLPVFSILVLMVKPVTRCLQDLKMVKQLGHPISWGDMFYLRWSHRYQSHQIQSQQVLGISCVPPDERKGAARTAFR